MPRVQASYPPKLRKTTFSTNDRATPALLPLSAATKKRAKAEHAPRLLEFSYRPLPVLLLSLRRPLRSHHNRRNGRSFVGLCLFSALLQPSSCRCGERFWICACLGRHVLHRLAKGQIGEQCSFCRRDGKTLSAQGIPRSPVRTTIFFTRSAARAADKSSCVQSPSGEGRNRDRTTRPRGRASVALASRRRSRRRR